jgi:uncharacterized membrane protein
VSEGTSAAVGNQGDTTRLETFSDGVFAIAITLLVLEIAVPHAEGGSPADLWRELRELWPSYVGYLISFVTIGIMWANHHLLFRHIVRTDHYLVLLNLLLLLCIGFLPFPTALLAEHLGHAGEGVAVIAYSGTFFVTAVAFNLLWWWPSHDRHLLAPDMSPRALKSINDRYRLGPPAYLVALVASFLYPPASLVILALLALTYVLPYAAP